MRVRQTSKFKLMFVEKIGKLLIRCLGHGDYSQAVLANGEVYIISIEKYEITKKVSLVSTRET